MTDLPATDLPAWASPGASAFDTKLGLELIELSAARVTGRAPVEGNTQPFGLWHGGASATLAETLASLGATMHAQPDRRAVGTELSISHIRSASTGWVHGCATAIHFGRGSAVYTVTLTDDDDRLLASARVTCRILG
ncbi:hotdog fold thioesterase [Brooklawnia cerclae]|uniref:Uncharacterized protein (TIGR00369 family) n=1 Tax=Brooklawnia cerclae TaxID=349934 RepID=A0ABX0SGI1_9ACTN|nr:PaaI family thioesterase [Brooklawnia cerclae]NIH57500.1 uncharacterized protein (TIGR00369 family) [Brooklawnia cerclae]